MKTISLLVALVSASSAFGSWSTFHGDNQRTGRTSQTLSANPTQRWTADMLGKVIVQPVVAADGTIYVGPVLTQEKIPHLVMNAVNPNGTIKWRFQCQFIDMQVMGTPALDSAGNLYFGTAAGDFYSLSPTGAERWRFHVNESIGTNVLAASDGNIYAKLGAELYSFTPAGAVRWHVDTGLNYQASVAETQAGKIIAFTAQGAASYTTSGVKEWQSTVGELGSMIVAPNGQIVVQTDWFNWLNPSTGAVDHISTGSSLYSTFSTAAMDAAGNLYFPETYNLYKILANGNEAVHSYFTVPNSGRLAQSWSSPVVDAVGRVYMGAGNISRTDLPYEMNLFVMSNTMSVLATKPMGHIAGTSSPAIGNTGEIYLGSLDGKLYCFR